MFSRLTDRLDLDVESLISRQNPQDDDDMTEVCAMIPALTLQQRVGGCLGCMLLGYVLSFGSFFRMRDLIVYGDPLPFVVVATLGNIISLCGSIFLVGPFSQVKKMFHPTRKLATILYLSSLIITLLVAFLCHGMPGQALLLVTLMVCQYVSISWYCLSYIPYARQMAYRLFTRLCSEIMDSDG